MGGLYKTDTYLYVSGTGSFGQRLTHYGRIYTSTSAGKTVERAHTAGSENRICFEFGSDMMVSGMQWGLVWVANRIFKKKNIEPREFRSGGSFANLGALVSCGHPWVATAIFSRTKSKYSSMSPKTSVQL